MPMMPTVVVSIIAVNSAVDSQKEPFMQPTIEEVTSQHCHAALASWSPKVPIVEITVYAEPFVTISNLPKLKRFA